MIAEPFVSDTAHLLAATLAAALALAVVYGIDRPAGSWGRRLRSRLLFGVPWGTLVAIVFVIGVYLFVQSGLENPNRPVVIPFRAWSYFYPEGVIWSGFAHSSRSHITGNLLSTLVAGTLAEYAYGHFPRDRGSSTFDSRGSVLERASSNPYLRAFLFVPGAILVFGAVSSLFALGPVIGFSGVVFALWGFALVHYPIGTIAALTASTLVRVVHSTLTTPIEFAEASSSYGPPSWANIAVQGHALGLIAGILVAVWLVRRRRDGNAGSHTSAIVVFAAVLLFGASRRLWAVYWYLGNEQYELYRAIGVALLVVLALIVAVAVAGRDEPLFSSASDSTRSRSSVRTATPAAIGVLLVVLALAAVAGPGVVPNLVTVDDGELPGDPIEVEGYQVTYAENVEDQMVSVIDIEAFGRSTSVRTSGVIVKHAERHIWTTAVSRGNLAHWEYRAIDVGGTGWRETVWAQRTGWVAADSGATYRVDLIHDGERSTAFVSDPREAEPRVDGRNVTVAAVEGGFELRVHHDGDTDVAPIPAANESVVLQDVRFVREDRAVFAERGDTRVRIADEERYQGRER